MPACSGRVLYHDGSRASNLKVEGKCEAGMVKTHTRSDGSFELTTNNTSGRFQKIFVNGRHVASDISGYHTFYAHK